MNIISIINNSVATISNCADEPIQIPGSIQPHGALLAVSADGIIRYCSENVVQFLGLEPAQLLNSSVEQRSTSLWASVLNALQAGEERPHPVSFAHGDHRFDVIIRRSDELILMELEHQSTSEHTEYEIYDQTQTFVSFIERAKTLKDLCHKVAAEVRRITGYDRVMIYRFDKEYNGEVYAESKKDDIVPFLGLHYPHTDIPPQARELYLRNLCRMIADVQYTPVPLLTTSDNGDTQLDLSDSVLRSVSPIHIEYLKNMGVGASLTISLLLEGRLWGLIACHHMSALTLPYAKRQQALMQGHFLSSQIRVQQVAEEYEVNVNVDAHLQQLLSKIDADEDLSQKMDQFTSLLAVANATGVAILHQGILYEKGLVPPRERTLSLIRWIAKNSNSVLFSTSHLSSRYPEGKAISKYASGIIFHALGKPAENCIIWFREEVERTVKWAGKPDTAVQMDPQTKRLTPRKSFEIWKESVRDRSAEWRVSEINAAVRFATSLQNHFHLQHIKREENNLRLLNEQLTKANQELSNINWITSHDLKEPLRKIQLFASRIMDKESESLSALILDHMKRIQQSAGRMQHLVEDIMSYTVVGNKDDLFSIVDLNAILAEVRTELNEELTEAHTLLHIESLPEHIRGIPFQMHQLFTNLIGNAIKFAKKDERGVIEVYSRQVNGDDVTNAALQPGRSYHSITVKDNGIGFDNAQARRIFDIFYRLHKQDEYKGTGMGLAICKKITENHGGAISCTGQPGLGAQFVVYIPALQ